MQQQNDDIKEPEDESDTDDNLYLKISVEDTGVGIKPHDQNKLFRLFGYLNETREKNVHGIGLGLVISKQIVEQFGGNIFLKSVFGIGTIFSFILKLKKEVLNIDQIQILDVSNNEVKSDS